MKEKTIKVSYQLKATEIGITGIKRRKFYVQLDEKIENIVQDYRRSNNLEKWLASQYCLTKTENRNNSVNMLLASFQLAARKIEAKGKLPAAFKPPMS